MTTTKKNLPHIPLYIGDWEKDCNALSLQSEGAWLKIIFKMWTKGKQSLYKIPTKSLQILWKSTPEKVEEIIEDLRLNEICEISLDKGVYEFICRKYEKENELSEIRSKAVSSRYKKEKILQKTYKTLQNADNDNDNDSNSKEYYKNEIEFLEDWGKVRKYFDGAKTLFKKLNFYERQNFDILKNEYTVDEFRDAMQGMFQQKRLYKELRVRPEHFLKDGNLEKYHDCKINKTDLFKNEATF